MPRPLTVTAAVTRVARVSAHPLPPASAAGGARLKSRPLTTIAAALICAGMSLPLDAAAQAQTAGTAQLVEQGRYWQGLRRPDRAEEIWQRLLRLDPASLDAMHGMALVEMARGRSDAARLWLDRLRTAQPGDSRVAELETRMREMSLRTPGQAADDLRRARALATAGKSAQALAVYRDVVGSGAPPDSIALEYYQAQAGTTDEWADGRRGLESMVKRDPTNAAARLALGRVRTYRENTRREGIKDLAALAQEDGAVAATARASWRDALLWLDARSADAPLFQAYLSAAGADSAVTSRLQALRAGRDDRASAPTATAAVQAPSPAAVRATQTPFATARTPMPAREPTNSVREEAASEGRQDASAFASAAAASASPVLAQAFSLLDAGDHAGAEAIFEEQLRLRPGEADAQAGLGLVRLKQQRFGEAVDLLGRASRASRTARAKFAAALRSATYWHAVQQGNEARDRGDLRAAAAAFGEAVRIDGTEPIALLGLAALRLNGGSPREAEQLYRRALAKAPQERQALEGIVEALQRQNRPQEATVFAERLARQAPALVGAGAVPNQVQQARAHAQEQLAAGQSAAAQRTLEDGLLLAPDDPWVRLDLARIYERQGLTDQARSLVNGLLVTHPRLPDALHAAALFASESGASAEALELVERVPPASRTPAITGLQRELWVRVQSERAQALVRQGRAAEARELLAAARASLGTRPDPRILGALAEAYADVGDVPGALALGRQLLVGGAGSASDRLRYANVLMKANQNAELAAVLRQLDASTLPSGERRQLEGLRTASAIRQADSLREAGNLEAAYATLAPFVASNPGDSGIVSAIARLYAAAHDDKQALALYTQLLQRDPRDVDAMLGAATSASALREHGDAQKWAQAALAAAPQQARVLATAGRVYRNAGDSARAQQYLRLAVAAESGRGASAPQGAPAAADQSRGNPFAGMTGAGSSASPAPLTPSAPLAILASAAGSGARPAVISDASGAGWGTAGLPSAPLAPSSSAPWPLAGPGAAGGTNVVGRPGATRPSAGAVALGQPGSVGAQASWEPRAVGSDGFAGNPGWEVRRAAAEGNRSPDPRGWAVAATAGPVAGTATSAAVASTLREELQALDAERSPTVSMGTVVRTRAGEAGLARLTDIQAPLEARIPAGNGKVVLGVTPTSLNAGTPTPDFPTGSRFGAGPEAALAQAQGRTAPLGSQSASGVGLSAGWDSERLSVRLGTTPLGFQEKNVIGHLAWNDRIGQSGNYKLNFSRTPVTDSLLSFAGTKDPRTGERWGGVVATGARGDVGYDDGSFGVYGFGAFHSLTGKNVQNNTRAAVGGGAYLHMLNDSKQSMTAGIYVGLMRHARNLSYFTYGHGGYFSPQSYFSLAFPIDWSGRSDRLAWRVNASLGIQSFRQAAAPLFPTDPGRQAAAVSAGANAAGLGLINIASPGSYAASSTTGVAYNLAGAMEYRLNPQLFLGGSLSFNNASNYRQITGGVYLRYLLDAQSGSTGALSLPMSPLVSPYGGS